MRQGRADHPFFSGVKNRPEVIAHQGGMGQWLAETIFAFEQAIKVGADVLELDIHSTRDGHLVLMHNATVDETSNGTGRIHRLLLSELKKLDAGYRWTANGGRTFPFRGKEIRVATLEASPQELLRFQLGNDPFTHPTSRPDCLQVKDRIKVIRIITRDSVARARRLNLPIHTWTVNDIDGMKRMIALEVDGIITDYPGPLLALLERRLP